MNRHTRRAALAIVAAALLGAGCGGGATTALLGAGGATSWEYRLAGIGAAEMEQATLVQYLSIKGKTEDEIRAMKADDVEAARKEMTEAFKNDDALVGKLKQFSGWYLITNLNRLGADGWELVQVRPEGEGLIFVLKRPGKAEPPPPPPGSAQPAP